MPGVGAGGRFLEPVGGGKRGVLCPQRRAVPGREAAGGCGVNAAELAQRMADQADTIATYLLPQGKKAGAEWKAGSVAGEPGQSLSVRLSGQKKGVWRDFATGDGGDMLDLWMACRSQSTGEAMRDSMAYLGIRDDRPEAPKKAWKRPSKPPCKAPRARVAQWLEGRGLTAETLASFKIGEQMRDGKSYAVFPYLRDGELVNAKYRNADDKRDMRQESGAEPCLFGWHLIDPKARTVAITEGEIDAMTLHQAGIPALSVNAGAGNHQWIENDWSRLERFSELLLCFDDDEAAELHVARPEDAPHGALAEQRDELIAPQLGPHRHLDGRGAEVDVGGVPHRRSW